MICGGGGAGGFWIGVTVSGWLCGVGMRGGLFGTF